MTDGSAYVPLSELPSDKHILSEEDVALILSKLESYYASALAKHMMSAERAAYKAGLEKGQKQ